MYHLSSKCSHSGHIRLCSNKSQVLLGGCSSLAFSRGSAEQHAKGLHALTRLREENNTSCCTELGKSHVLPWAGCWWAQGLPAPLSVSSCKSWHAARSMSWLFTSWWRPLSSQAGLQDCLPITLTARRPTRSINAMGTTECNRSSTTVPLQEIAVPSSTEGASPCSGLPTWPLCSAAMSHPMSHPYVTSPTPLVGMMTYPLLTLTILLAYMAFNDEMAMTAASSSLPSRLS